MTLDPRLSASDIFELVEIAAADPNAFDEKTRAALRAEQRRGLRLGQKAMRAALSSRFPKLALGQDRNAEKAPSRSRGPEAV